MIKTTSIENEELYIISDRLKDKKVKLYLNYKIIEIIEFDKSLFKKIYEYQLEGFVIIIKYPEKIKKIKRNPNIINSFIDANCLFMVDIKSLNGENGVDSKKLARKFVKLNIYNFMSIDGFDKSKLQGELKNYLHLDDILKESYNKLDNGENIDFIGTKLKNKSFF